MNEMTGQPAPSGLSFRRLAVIGKRQWWVVIGCIVLAAVGSAAYYKTSKVTYTVGATVTVTPPSLGSSAAATPTSSTGNALFQGDLDPAAEVASPAVVAAAAAGAHLPKGAVTLGAALSSDQTTVAVSATAPSAAQAAGAANAAANAFVKQRITDLDASAKALDPRIRYLSAQIFSLNAEIHRAGRNGNVGGAGTQRTVFTGLLSNAYADQQAFIGAANSVAVSSHASAYAATPGGRSKRTVAVALVAGLLAGLGIALAREQFDDKLRSSNEVPEIGPVDVLAELPRSDLGSKSATIGDKPYGELAEAVRDLRTALRFLSVKRPIRTILVTSARSGEGKSFVAANLAAAWAISGVKTILVSSDLRRPSLERVFKVEAARRGLSEAIIDAALSGHDRPAGPWAYAEGEDESDDGRPAEEIADSEVDALLVPTGVEGLSLLPSGPTPPNPAELLGSPEFGKLLVALRERAEVVVLDSPPVLAVTDALVLTAQADGVLLVVAENRTSRSAAQRALRQMESGLAPVLGVVVNRSSRPDSERY